MAILPVYLYDHPVLKKKTIPVQEISDEIKELTSNMLETMYNAPGIGLAANQVGETHRLFVCDISEDGNEPLIVINPSIKEFFGDDTEMEEGCLSLPNLRDNVIRPDGIVLEFLDIEGNQREMKVDGLLSRVMQHEIDHLEGMYFFERLSPVRKARSYAMLKRIARGIEGAEYPVEPGSRKATR